MMEGKAIENVNDGTLTGNVVMKDSLLLKTSISAESRPLTQADRDQITFGAFVLPFLALIIASGLKYFVNSKITTGGLWNVFLELSIDSLTIVIAVITTYYYRVSSISKLVCLILVAIFFIGVASAIRRAVIDGRVKKKKWLFASYFICWVISIVGMLAVYRLIIFAYV